MARVSLVLVALLLVATPAFAGDVCVQSGTDVFVFKNPKFPRKPLAVAPLLGYMLRGSFAYPLEGSALGASEGIAAIGATVHLLGGLANTLSLTVIVDQTFAGTGSIDSDGDGDVDVSADWTPISCESL